MLIQYDCNPVKLLANIEQDIAEALVQFFQVKRWRGVVTLKTENVTQTANAKSDSIEVARDP